MSFRSIRLRSFRNLEDNQVSTDSRRIFLVGDNGQGKSNFLEALYYCSFGSSFRGSRDSEAVKHGFDGFAVASTNSERSAVPEHGSPAPDDTTVVAWTGSTKEIRMNGKIVRDRKELLGRTPCIIFCHEDFSFAMGEPERRRFFFDQTASLVSNTYVDTLRDYRRILKQRNALLKTRDTSLLDTYDQQLASSGVPLVSARSRLRDEIACRFTGLYESVSLSGSPVGIEYRPGWRGEPTIENAVRQLADRRAEELAAGTTLSGPHRDRWIFSCGDRSFTENASTGQLRLVSLVLRIVQAEHYSSVTGRLPVLLLDDVLLELDPAKRIRLLELLPESAQAFFTFLPGEPWREYADGSTLTYKVHNGTFTV